MNYPKLINAKVEKHLHLILYYSNDEVRMIDIEKYCQSDFFKELKDESYFKQVQVKNNVLCWPNEQDIAPETSYLDSVVASN